MDTPAPTSPHSCTSGYRPFGNACYKLVPTKTTWSTALATCQQESAQLVYIYDAVENAALFALYQGIDTVWIGLSDLEVTSKSACFLLYYLF